LARRAAASARGLVRSQALLCPVLSTARARVPRAFALARRLVHAPAEPHRPLAAMQRRFPQGTVGHHPTLHGRMVDRYAALLQEFFDRPVAQGRGDIPPPAHPNPILWPVGSLATERQRRSPSLCPVAHWENPSHKSSHMPSCDKARSL